MVRKTRSQTRKEERETPQPPLVSVGESTTRRGVAQRSHSSPDLGKKESDEESSSFSSLDTSGDSGTAATPLVSGRTAPEVPQEITATASLPARLAGKKATPASKTKSTPASNRKAKATPVSKTKSLAKKDPITPASASSSVRSVRSKNPLRTNSAGLDPKIQQVVCQQIENKGGIVEFHNSGVSNPLHKLAEECSKDEEKGGVKIWGEAGSKRRIAIKDKVLRWKNLSDADYLGLCNQLEVKTAAVLSTRTRLFASPDTKPAPVLLQPIPEPTTEPARTTMQDHSGGLCGKLNQYFLLTIDADTPNNHSPSANSITGPKVVTIDVNYPEYNEPVFVVPFKNFKCRNGYYTGYDITVIADIREFDDDMHVMKFRSATEVGNVIEYSKPAWPLTFTTDVAEFDKAEKYEEVQIGHDVARTTFKETDVRSKLFYHLVFPPDCKLTNDPFRDDTAGGDVILEPQLRPLRVDTGQTDMNNKKVMTFIVRNTWKVIDLSTKDSVAGKDKGKMGKKQLSAAFSGLDISKD